MRRPKAKVPPAEEATLAIEITCEDCGIDSGKRRRVIDPVTKVARDLAPIFLAMDPAPLEGFVGPKPVKPVGFKCHWCWIDGMHAAKGADPPLRACLIVDR